MCSCAGSFGNTWMTSKSTLLNDDFCDSRKIGRQPRRVSNHVTDLNNIVLHAAQQYCTRQLLF